MIIWSKISICFNCLIWYWIWGNHSDRFFILLSLFKNNERGLRDHLAVCLSPYQLLNAYSRRSAVRRERLEKSIAGPSSRVTECLLETNSPKEEAVGEEHSETQPEDESSRSVWYCGGIRGRGHHRRQWCAPQWRRNDGAPVGYLGRTPVTFAYFYGFSLVSPRIQDNTFIIPWPLHSQSSPVHHSSITVPLHAMHCRDWQPLRRTSDPVDCSDDAVQYLALVGFRTLSLVRYSGIRTEALPSAPYENSLPTFK